MEELTLTPSGPTLYLIPCTLGDTAPMEVLPLTVRKIIEPLTHFIVENEKEARRFIKRIAPQKKQDQLELYPLNKFTDPWNCNITSIHWQQDNLWDYFLTQDAQA